MIESFEVIDATTHPEILQEYNIPGVPSWIINNQIYIGVQDLKKLKEVTGC